LWDDVSILEPLIKEYESQNPNIKISYEKVSKDKYRERLIARSQASTGPDIFQFHNTWLPQLTMLASSIPEDILPATTFDQTFYPIHQSDLKIDGSYYGIPLMIDGLVLVYNSDLLRQAGFNNPPQLWVGGENDMLSIASAITVKDASSALITSGIAMGEAENIPHFSEIFTVLLLQNGGNLKSLDNREATEALQVYRKFSEDNIWNLSMPNAISAFSQGKVAMIIVPSWQIHGIMAQNPEIQIGVSELPKGIDNKQVSLSHYWVEGVSKNSQNQREAWKFLYFLSQKEQLVKIYEQQTKVRLFGNAYSRKDMASLLSENKYLAPVISQAQNSAYVTLPVSDLTFDNGVNDEVIQYLKNAVNDTSKGVDYAEALKTAQNGVTQVYSRYLE
jgi:multiple sugar transport system substrate-binding protein